MIERHLRLKMVLDLILELKSKVLGQESREHLSIKRR